MPKGIPKKKESSEVAQDAPVVIDVKPEKPKLEPLGPGQAYYEAPDGAIIIGDAGKDRVWYRAGNGGKGMWINPKR